MTITEERKAYLLKYRQRERDRSQTLILEAKSRPCADCQQTYPYYVMDFDHVEGDKLFNIGASRHRGIRLIAAEIAKCDVVCSNCHRIRTHERKSLVLPR